MSQIKIEVPAAEKELAAALGKVLVDFGNGLLETTKDENTPVAVNPVEDGEPIDVNREPAPTVVVSKTEHPADDTGSELDSNGVMFNDQFCGRAATPFYGSGSRIGQWKKRRGVSDAEYDEWYREELDRVKSSDTNSDDDLDYGDTPDTAAAFGGEVETTPVQPPAPEDIGSFMSWVAEMKAAGKLTDSMVSEAYTETSVSVNDLFDLSKAKDLIAKVYSVLTTKLVD